MAQAVRVGPLDAEFMETIFTPEFTKEDLVNVGLYQMYLTLMIDGVGSRPFSATGLPPIEAPPISYAKDAIESSRQQFGAVRAKIEESIFAELQAQSAATVEPPKRKPSSGAGTSGPQNREGNAPRPQSQNREGGAPRPSQGPRTEQRTQDRPQQRRPEGGNGANAERSRPDPQQNAKTADDLKAILRGMTAGKEKEVQKQVEKKQE